MVAEQTASSTGAAGAPVIAAPASEVQTVDREEKMMKIVAMTVKQVIGELIPQLQRPQYESSRRETVEDKRKVCLDEQYSRMIEKYTGDSTQFRMWIFNLEVALGQVDSNLAQEVSKVLMREDASRFPSDWDPASDIS
eukprot:9868469-Karenia_brevis.AAC.1